MKADDTLARAYLKACGISVGPQMYSKHGEISFRLDSHLMLATKYLSERVAFHIDKQDPSLFLHRTWYVSPTRQISITVALGSRDKAIKIVDHVAAKHK